jgi:hypothetical protein
MSVDSRRARVYRRISPSSYPPLVLLLEHIGGVQVEGWRGARARTSEFGVAPVTDGDFFEVPIHDEVDERCAAEDAVSDEIAAYPVEAGADGGADDDDRQSHLWIEILSRVEIFAATHWTSIDGAIVADRFADRQGDPASASAAPNGARGVGGSDGKTGITLWTFGEDLHVAYVV